MDYQAFILIPVAIIFWGWHKSNPRPKNNYTPDHRGLSASYAGSTKFLPDDLDSDAGFPVKRIGTMSSSIEDDSTEIGFPTRSFLDDMLDPAQAYLPFNIYHEDCIFHSDIPTTHIED